MSAPGSPEPDHGAGAAEIADDPGWRAARRALVLFVVAVAAAAIGGIALLSGLVDEDGGDTTVNDSTADEVVAIGPRAGTEVDAYIEARRQHLRETEGRRAAVVSFDTYLRGDDARALLVDGVELVSLLVAFPSGPSVLADTVEDIRAATVADAEAQVADISELVDSVEDQEFAEFYRSELLRYRALIDSAGEDAVVHGAVVVGRAADLRAIASRDGVRLVDAGDGDRLSEDVTLAGLRPEESVTAGEPPFRP